MAGNAFVFDGRSAVKVRSTDDLEFADGEPFTWGMWIYEESQYSQHLFGKRHGCAGGGAFDYQFFSEPVGKSHWGPDACEADVYGEPELDTWQYLVGTYDGRASTCTWTASWRAAAGTAWGRHERFRCRVPDRRLGILCGLDRPRRRSDALESHAHCDEIVCLTAP
jgi:hypothetical protein